MFGHCSDMIESRLGLGLEDVFSGRGAGWIRAECRLVEGFEVMGRGLGIGYEWIGAGKDKVVQTWHLKEGFIFVFMLG